MGGQQRYGGFSVKWLGVCYLELWVCMMTLGSA